MLEVSCPSVEPTDHIVPPGDYIRQELEKRGWSQQTLAEVIGRPLPTVNEIIQGRRGIMPEMAVALGAAFGTSGSLWLRRESEYRLAQINPSDPEIQHRARLHAIAPVKDMVKRGWINPGQSAEDLNQALCRFFGVDNLITPPAITANARQSTGTLELNPSQRAWCFQARRLARTMDAAPYSDANFDSGRDELRKFAAHAELIRHLPGVLGKLGVRLVIVEHLPNTRIDGAAFWLSPIAPVVALSLRFDRIDCFWHTLCHELSHIRNRDGEAIDDSLVGESKEDTSTLSKLELRADVEAANMLIPAEKLRSFIIRVKPFYSKTRIIQFACRMGIHPGIVTGQLQHKGELSYATCRETLVKVRQIATTTVITDGWGHQPAIP